MQPILLVQAKGGPEPSYVLEKAAAVAEVHLLVTRPMPAAADDVAARLCASITDATDDALAGDGLVHRIVAEARRHGVAAIATFSEFALLAVTEASRQLGLRSAGENVVCARDKARMRRIWAAAGVPVPAFRPVSSLAELWSAWDELSTPFLLKAAWGSGSIGQVLIHQRADVEPAWQQARAAISGAAAKDMVELHSAGATDVFVAEELIRATTESWYDTPGYGDYLSVEGVVVDGAYHPVSISARLPTIPPFTDLGTQSPSVLPESAQRRIIDVSRQAVDALELENCGTHTEIKLLADQQLCVVETGARLGGGVLIREVETVWGVDLIGAVVLALLGEDPKLPQEPHTSGAGCAAATVALLGANSAGEPWRTSPPFDPYRVPWDELLSPGSDVLIVPDHVKVEPGEPMPVYDGPNGVLNFGGFALLRATDPQNLLRDSYSIIDNLERVLNAQAAR